MPPIFADNEISLFAPVFPWVGFALAILSFFLSIRACRRQRLIDNLPTSKTQGVFIGLVELKGTAECEAPLTSYLAEATCVYYAYAIRERWSRQVTTEESDGHGGTTLETHTETGWTSVASETQMTPFYLLDDTGHILIQPEGAKIEPTRSFQQQCSIGDPLYYGKGPSTCVADSDDVREFVEHVVALHAPLFVVGQARERQDIVAPEIAADPLGAEFLISTRTQEEVSSGLGWQFLCFFALGAIASWGGHAFGDMVSDDPFPAHAILYYLAEIFLFLVLWVGGWILTVYNSLIELRQRVGQGWGQVEIQLKRRHDLIPNLVQAVRGYRDHEAATHASVANIRAQTAATPPGQPGDDFRSVAGDLQLLKEAYPDLKADQNFLALQQTLSDTESRIALARGYFNSIATFYNTRLEVVPDRFLAALAGMKPRALMAANDFERAPVEVDFASAPK